MSVLTHVSFYILRHYQGAKHFAMDRRLRIETPRWRVLDFSRNTLPVDEVKRSRFRIIWTPFVRRDREHPFCEDLIKDDAGVVDPHLPILTKVLCLLEVL